MDSIPISSPTAPAPASAKDRSQRSCSQGWPRMCHAQEEVAARVAMSRICECSALAQGHDTLSEWLRRWTRNPLGSARRGSNPLGVAFTFLS
jgi:hypothetical protein